tara:strand:- start:1292 stop:1495 length:204 start_codon:yes stop_codon:yes gene_type:complete
MTYTPIAVAFKKKYGKKVYVKEFTDQRTPDKILSSRSKLLPKYCEIVEIGVGTKFYEKYIQKYKNLI